MPQSFLGVGWSFPVAPDTSGALGIAAYDESVRQAVWIVLGTAKGERVMHPDFGCGIHDLVFELNTAATAGRVTKAVKEALLAFEPRIDLLDVQVQAQSGGEVLQISLDYRVRATNNTFNLVFPFYLEQGAAQ
jgi:phage baseplate assembly protein W